MSVDTNVKGKNLSPYRKHRIEDGLQILVSPQLTGIASLMRVEVAGGLRKKLAVELSDGSDPSSCSI